MQWYTRNPELARPIAVCLLLVGGAVLAEAVVPSGDVEAARKDDRIIYETKVDLSTNGSAKNDRISAPSPYFDQDDPVE